MSILNLSKHFTILLAVLVVAVSANIKSPVHTSHTECLRFISNTITKSMKEKVQDKKIAIFEREAKNIPDLVKDCAEKSTWDYAIRENKGHKEISTCFELSHKLFSTIVAD